MNRSMKVVVALVVVCGLGMTAVSADAAKKPVASYALGKAKSCRADYAKKTQTKTVTEFSFITRQAAKVKIRYVACVYDPNIGVPTHITFTPATTTTTTAVPTASATAPTTIATPTTTTATSTTTTTTMPTPTVSDVSVNEVTTWNQTAGSSPFVTGQTESFLGSVSASISLTADGGNVAPPAGTLSFTVSADYLGSITLVTESAGQTSCDIAVTGENIELIQSTLEGSWRWTSDNCSGGDPDLDNTQGMTDVAALSVTTTFSDINYTVTNSNQ